MSNTINTSSPATPSQNFYLGDHFNFSIDIKDTKMSKPPNQKPENSFQFSKLDQVLQNGDQKCHRRNSSILDGIDQNQFMNGFISNWKNAEYPSPNIQKNIFHESPINQEGNHTSIPKHNEESENQNSFLLDSETYKEICMAEHSRKSEFVLDSSYAMSSSNLQNKCQIHDSPLQIVCIEDKCLVCSHCAIFGDHKAHSLAPLKHIQKFMSEKETEVNEIITNYKNLQLGIKQKSFLGEFSDKINQKRIETKTKVDQSFKLIRQCITTYQCEVSDEIQKFYSSLEGKITETIRRISLDSNKEAFEQWQRDASNVISQMSFRELPKMNRINIFLSNFSIPESISNCISRQSDEMVSMEQEGKKYLEQIKEELDLTINNVMKTVEKFKVNLNHDYPHRIREFLTFECESHIEDFVQQNNFRIIHNQLQSATSLISIRESFNLLNETRNSINFNLKQPELASTFSSMSQSGPIFGMSLGLKKVNTAMKKRQVTKEQNTPQNNKKPLKFTRRETLEDTRRMQGSVRSVDCPFNLLESKSSCQQTFDRQRKISPCIKNMVKVQNAHLFESRATSRIGRCSSREPANIYSPMGFKNQQDSKDFKRKNQVSQFQAQDPLSVIQNYQHVETQTFDLSNCNLNDTEILYFVQKASKIRKIRHLKLASNLMTSAGLQRILPYLSHCNLINLSNNKLSEMAIDLLLRRRQRISQLKMLNLANNKLNQRKIREKIMEFKKLGIVVTL